MASQLTASKRKIRTTYGDRVVYVGVRGGEYVKLNGKFVSVSKLPKKASNNKVGGTDNTAKRMCEELNNCEECTYHEDEDTWMCESEKNINNTRMQYFEKMTPSQQQRFNQQHGIVIGQKRFGKN